MTIIGRLVGWSRYLFGIGNEPYPLSTAVLSRSRQFYILQQYNNKSTSQKVDGLPMISLWEKSGSFFIDHIFMINIFFYLKLIKEKRWFLLLWSLIPNIKSKWPFFPLLSFFCCCRKATCNQSAEFSAVSNARVNALLCVSFFMTLITSRVCITFDVQLWWMSLFYYR